MPDSYRYGAVGLGAGIWYTIRTILLPSAMPGIITGIILSIGLIAGEPAALIFTAGSAKGFPKSISALFKKILESGGTLTTQLYLLSTSEGDFETADLILLDVMLPDEDGYKIVRNIRNSITTRNIPVIMVTAKTEEIDMLRGLDSGADDYIKKPFSVMEMLSRVRALLRRNKNDISEQLNLGGITIDNNRHSVTAGNDNIILTLKEYELLYYLMNNENIVMTREVLMREVCGTDFEGETRTVDMHIKTLRKKLGEYGNQIRTVRGVGYSISRECSKEE